mgnify:CR=1 FL=1
MQICGTTKLKNNKSCQVSGFSFQIRYKKTENQKSFQMGSLRSLTSLRSLKTRIAMTTTEL